MRKVVIDEDKCKGCELCVNACPKGVLELAGERMNIKGFHPASLKDEESCISCAFCAMMCPDVCIDVYK